MEMKHEYAPQEVGLIWGPECKSIHLFWFHSLFFPNFAHIALNEISSLCSSLTMHCQTCDFLLAGSCSLWRKVFTLGYVFPGCHEREAVSRACASAMRTLSGGISDHTYKCSRRLRKKLNGLGGRGYWAGSREGFMGVKVKEVFVGILLDGDVWSDIRVLFSQLKPSQSVMIRTLTLGLQQQCGCGGGFALALALAVRSVGCCGRR